MKRSCVQVLVIDCRAQALCYLAFRSGVGKRVYERCALGNERCSRRGCLRNASPVKTREPE